MVLELVGTAVVVVAICLLLSLVLNGSVLRFREGANPGDTMAQLLVKVEMPVVAISLVSSPSSSCIIIFIFVSSDVSVVFFTSRLLLMLFSESTKVSGFANFMRLLRLLIFSLFCNENGAEETSPPPPHLVAFAMPAVLLSTVLKFVV